MNEVIRNVRAILDELTHNSALIEDNGFEQLLDEIVSAKRIFLAGSGRSGLVIRAFANRLMHLGLNVNVIGDVTTTFAREGDLLIIGSGSGETQSLVAMSQKAKKNNLRIALLTMAPGSTIAKLANAVCVLPGASPKVKEGEPQLVSIQPMGSGFEQLSLIVYDATIMALMSRVNQTSDSMFGRHANLE
ncbi:TPA: 6-phospho-3-hexuloisomerase [Klebsiella oxytoca]|uniref:6-phospho-3-hexuloisomerase n=1 Tax=Klebsiella oxytoca TaxID=571 RepID=UPI001CCCAA50|nr:6-phospho-3-hexuloisomerase [Klebsiella oxytoca]MBZ7658800.1 6-phospho-3-hexuloisomerase [Klebsiella oxytoca]HCM6212192.1 6-phospho-3-hexuloisomerase [Klebsiella oxytoca]HCM6217086.1 6-phospho-3-hexuloisomerase [Klebsiella oxytoca]